MGFFTTESMICCASVDDVEDCWRDCTKLVKSSKLGGDVRFGVVVEMSVAAVTVVGVDGQEVREGEDNGELLVVEDDSSYLLRVGERNDDVDHVVKSCCFKMLFVVFIGVIFVHDDILFTPPAPGVIL